MSAKILFFDIETAPETAYIWKRFDTTVGQSQVKEPGYLLCISWAWMGEAPQTLGIYNGRSWKRGDRRDDSQVVKKAHELFDEADIIVGHNVERFDIATLNARFVKYNLPPPSPFKVCDTYKLLKKYFNMPSRSLESASVYFGIEIKEKQPFSLWRDCMDGVAEAWERLLTYCAHDVTVVRQLYYKLLPFANQHPNQNQYTLETIPVCPKCASTNIEQKGISKTATNAYNRFQCQDCGGWMRSRSANKDQKKTTLTHAL